MDIGYNIIITPKHLDLYYGMYVCIIIIIVYLLLIMIRMNNSTQSYMKHGDNIYFSIIVLLKMPKSYSARSLPSLTATFMQVSMWVDGWW